MQTISKAGKARPVLSGRCARAAIRGVCAALWTLTATLPAQAQSLAPSGAQRATRVELAERLAIVQQQLADSKLTARDRAKALAEAAALQSRLELGDFRVGDRFVITVRQEQERSDTISVRDSLKVSIGGMPDATLTGVLRSELNERLSAHLARYLRNATVRSSVLTRVAILGAVGRPGYYYAPPDRPVTELVMLAGGPAPTANINELEITRGAAKLLKSKDSKRAIKDGRTLEQLDVQSGDEVRVPAKRKINFQALIQLMFVVSSLFFAFVQFIQWYYSRQE